MFRLCTLVFLAVGMWGCSTATLTDSGLSIRDVDAGAVDDCAFLGEVTETAYSGMLFASSGLDVARKKVRNTAARMGSTHLLWGEIAAGGAVQVASGRAYRCEDS